jgi:hypothetical protein
MASNRYDTRHCSFCSKSEFEVKKLLAAPGACICDGCLDESNHIMGNEGPSDWPWGRVSEPVQLAPLQPWALVNKPPKAITFSTPMRLQAKVPRSNQTVHMGFQRGDHD